MGFLGMLIT